jgi:hypothetical protein
MVLSVPKGRATGLPYLIQPGRPSAITAEKVATIVDGVRRGMSFAGAGKLAGVYQQTSHYWLRTGIKLDLDDSLDESRLTRTDRLYILLARGVTVAQGQLERDMVDRLNEASRDDWHAAKFLLERRFEEWRSVRQGRIEISYSAVVVEPPEADAINEQDRFNALVRAARQYTPKRELPAPPTCAHGLRECPTCEPKTPERTPTVRSGCEAGDHKLNHNRTLCLRCGTGWSRPREYPPAD